MQYLNKVNTVKKEDKTDIQLSVSHRLYLVLLLIFLNFLLQETETEYGNLSIQPKHPKASRKASAK